MTIPRVVYWNTIPSPYLVDRFNVVADRGILDFEAWFDQRNHPAYRWEIDESQWRFRYRYLPSVGVGNRRITLPTPVFGTHLPDVLVSLYAQPSFLIGSTVARKRGVRTAFWAQVTRDAWVPRQKWKERVKQFAFPRVDATLGSGEESRSFAMRYGTPPERAMTLPHVVDSAHFRAGRSAALHERDNIRASIGLRGVTFVYVGRLWWGKGLGHLLNAFAVLQRRLDEEISLMFIGDGPDETSLRQRIPSEGIRNVIFANFQQHSELPRFLTASDVFVFPTLGDPYGLVVDEAMATSLPVISTSAAGEIRDRVTEGIEGFIVPPADSAALMERMEVLARDELLRMRMGLAAAEKMHDSTPLRWAIDFEKVIEQVLNRDPSRDDRR